MKNTVSKNDFRNEFKQAGRENQFTPYALGELFDYLEDHEEQTGEEVELDVVALCCEYSEYESFGELQQNYNVPNDFEEARDYLEDRTQIDRKSVV